jgi:hypothetical protein
MFESNMTEVQTDTLTMEAMSAAGVEGFLKYFYTGGLDEVAKNLTLAFEMLQAGHKYEINDMELACKVILKKAEGKLFDAATALEIHQFCKIVKGLEDLDDHAFLAFIG